MDKYKKRLKEYLENKVTGIVGERQLLSGILSFSETVEKPEALAEILLKKYISVENILNLVNSDMMKDDLIDANTMCLMKLILEASARRLVQAGIGRIISSPLEACRFFEETYQGMNVEELRMVCLDSDLRIVDYAIIARGDIYSVTFDKDELLKKAVSSGCKICIIAHNHPGAPSKPSCADYTVTNRLRRYFDELGITLIEHIIIGEDGAKSLFAQKMIFRYFS